APPLPSRPSPGSRASRAPGRAGRRSGPGPWRTRPRAACGSSSRGRARPSARRGSGRAPTSPLAHQVQDVPELLALGAQILEVLVVGPHLQRDQLDELEAVALE